VASSKDRQQLAAIPHSSNEPDDLLQWLCHDSDNSTINTAQLSSSSSSSPPSSSSSSIRGKLGNGKVGNGKLGNGKLGNRKIRQPFFGGVGKVGNGKTGQR